VNVEVRFVGGIERVTVLEIVRHVTRLEEKMKRENQQKNPDEGVFGKI
jgi:hypothetical protein